MNAPSRPRSLGSLLDTIEGHVSWILRNADGSIAEQGEGKNLFTRSGRRSIVTASYLGDQDLPRSVVILDDEHPAGIKEGLRCFKIDTLTPTPVQVITTTVAGYTRTYTGSFAAPSATRTIRKIGLASGGPYSGHAEEGGMRGVSAYLTLTTPVTQTTAQTFEFTYRLALVVSSAKSLGRFNFWTPIMEAERATDLVSGGVGGYSVFHVIRAVCGSHYFVDGGLVHRGATDCAYDQYGYPWRTKQLTFSDSTLQRRGTDHTFLITNSYNNYGQGSVGMMVSGLGYGGSSLQSGSPDRAVGFTPLAAYEGSISNVFKHVAGETYIWNVVGSVALSQGNVEIRGPYIPDEHKSPWHWSHWLVMDTSGDTDGGTEGEYHFRRMAGDYPYPTFSATLDNVWDQCEHLGSFIVNHTEAGNAEMRHQIAFDGEFYWLATYTTGVNVRLMRWRGGSNEQIWSDSVGDTTRWQPFTAPNATSGPYGVASDGAGVTWLAATNSVLANQKLYKIDNTKPGRHYQRPSGAVLTANPATFTVDASDEIHTMFPFVVGDVGRKIRTVNTVSNGADTTRTITAYNSPTSVDVDGAAFVTEVGMTWHWETVTAMASNPWPAQLKGWLGYDAANARLWAMSDSGLHFSLDSGATWTTIDEGNGLTTTLAKTLLAPNGDDNARTILVGNGGKLYWIDTNNAVNKYTPVPVTVVSGTHERVTNAALPAAPSGYTKGTLSSLIYDGTAPDLVNGDGALWLGQDRIYLRCFWHMACGPTFVSGGATAYSETSIGGAPGSYLDYSFQNGFASPDGSVWFWNKSRPTQWKKCYFNESTGVLTWINEGNVWNPSGGGLGDVHVRPNGLVLARTSTYTSANTAVLGFFCGAPVTYRYDDLADTWRPFLGSAVQFDAKYGTTNGGKRKCHAAWQKVLKGAYPNNLELRFVQAGGAVAPADEFVAGESFTWRAAYGLLRTNVQDLTWRVDQSWADVDALVEAEAIKTVVAPAALKTYFWRVGSSAGETAKPLGVAAYPTNIPELTAGGVNYGWKPARASWLGGGSLPDTSSATFGATTFSQTLIGLDLGAAPPAISRLHTTVHGAAFYYLLQNYHRTSTDRGRMKVYYSDDNVAWTEVPEVMFQLNGASPPAAGYANVYVEHYPQGGNAPNSGDGHMHVTFDLEGAGLGVGARTHRYWQIHIGNNGTTNTTVGSFGSVYATDGADIPIGLTSAFRTDEAHDVNHGASWIHNVDFIQTRTGVEGQGGINTVDDGDADGRTNTVTIASGSFETGDISTVTDYLAWKESPGVGNGYIRRPRGEPGRAMPWTSGYQARSRIISANATTIVVADDIIPDGLSAVDFEIRRPATGTVLSAGSMPWQDYQTGYFQFHSADLGREFRITRKAIIRLP